MAVPLQPYFLDQILFAFLANADFGPIYQEQVLPGGWQAQCVVSTLRMQDLIPTVMAHGVITPTLTNALFLAYFKAHDLNAGFTWRLDETMNDYLGDTIRLIADEEGYNDGTGWYNSFFTDALIRRLRDPYLSPADHVYLTNPQLTADLNAEFEAVRIHLRCLNAEILRAQANTPRTLRVSQDNEFEAVRAHLRSLR